MILCALQNYKFYNYITFFCIVDDLRVIIDKMRKDHIAKSQWKRFSHLLGIRPSALNYIETVYRGDENRILFYVLVDWIQGNGKTEPTWVNLVKALDGIGAWRAAEEIRGSKLYSCTIDDPICENHVHNCET